MGVLLDDMVTAAKIARDSYLGSATRHNHNNKAQLVRDSYKVLAWIGGPGTWSRTDTLIVQVKYRSHGPSGVRSWKTLVKRAFPRPFGSREFEPGHPNYSDDHIKAGCRIDLNRRYLWSSNGRRWSEKRLTTHEEKIETFTTHLDILEEQGISPRLRPSRWGDHYELADR